MTKKTSELIKESVVRRWGKLANIGSLTENWIGEQDEALDDEMDAAEDEVAAGEAEMEAGEEAEASVEEQEAVERIVGAVVDALAAETGVEIEVEEAGDDEAAMDDMDAGMDASDELDDAADDEMDAADAAAMRDPYNRTDEDKAFTAKREKRGADKRKGAEKRGAEGTKKKTSGKGRGEKKGDDAYANNRKDETLNIDVIDDENLTEAVLQRVVERLLRRK